MEDILNNLKDPWRRPDSENCSALEKELQKELTKEHILFGLKAKCIARRGDNDDVLFMIDSDKFLYAVVHLTWASEFNSDFPVTEVFNDFNHWVTKGYEKDVAEYEA